VLVPEPELSGYQHHKKFMKEIGVERTVFKDIQDIDRTFPRQVPVVG
jgi:hypothetical protein